MTTKRSRELWASYPWTWTERVAHTHVQVAREKVILLHTKAPLCFAREVVATLARMSEFSVAWAKLDAYEKANNDLHGILIIRYSDTIWREPIKSLSHPWWEARDMETSKETFKDDFIEMLFNTKHFSYAHQWDICCVFLACPTYFEVLNFNIMKGERKSIFMNVDKKRKREVENKSSDAGNRTLAVRVKAEYPNH